MRKKKTNYAEIFRNIMRKKVLIMRKKRWIMRKIFGSLRSPKLTSFHAAEIELLPKPRVCSQDNFKQKKLYWYLGFSSYFHLYLVCYETRVQNSSRLSAVAGTLTTLVGYFSPKKHKISCLDRPTEFKVAVS